MKKRSHIFASMLRLAIFLSPGVATVLMPDKIPGWIFRVLAGLGVELIIGVVITLGVAVAAQLEVRKETAPAKEEPEE